MDNQQPVTLQIDNLRVAALSLAIAVKRGAFEISEVAEVASCHKNIQDFLDRWRQENPGATVPADQKQPPALAAEEQKKDT